MMRSAVSVALAAGLSCSAASAALPAPRNPWLADSSYPLPHGNCAQLDATPVRGPGGPGHRSRPLKPGEIEYTHLGPGHFGAFISSPYPHRRRVLWSNGLNGVVKMDHDSFEVLATLPGEGETYDSAHAEVAIARFDRSNHGFLDIVAAFRNIRMFRDLSGVYGLVDRDNRFYVGHKTGSILAYGDVAPADDPSLPIELKGRYDFPDGITGNLVGINMTFDGWLVTATEHGYVVLVSRDLKQSRHIRLRHAEGSEDENVRPGYGWVRNSFAVDKDGGIYIVSRDHMHKVVWNGKALSIDEADGAWTVPYPNNSGDGSGATPTLMGFGREDRLVVITDGDKLMNLVVLWRDDIPGDWKGLPNAPSRRIAGMLPVTMGGLNLEAIQSEQSVVVAGYGALVVNNQPRNPPWYLPDRASRLLVSFLGSNPEYQPYGVEKFVWDPKARKLKTAWVNEAVSSPNSVPIVSTRSNRVYFVGARDNAWTLEALDWETGAADFHYLIGGQRYNSMFSGTLIDENGRIFYGTTWGRVRLEPE